MKRQATISSSEVGQAYLVSDIVGEPVKTLVEPFTRGGASALDIPTRKCITMIRNKLWNNKG